MILFIRDNCSDNNTIVDIEIWNGENGVDLSVFVDIEHYSKLLLSTPTDQQHELIGTFSRVQELRGWLFESFLPVYQDAFDEETYNAVVCNVRKGLNEIVEKYRLYYTED